jgi:cardiolipin synthase (CMP-forming)
MWNISNILSLSRIPFAAAIGVALFYNENVIAVILCLLAAVTDILDGHLARKYSHVSELGKILDPLADKVLFISIVICLIILERIPLWFAFAIIGRDALIMIGSIFVSRKIKMVIPSNYIGKATVIILGLALIFIILDVQVLILPFSILSTAALAISFIVYTIGMIKRLKTII